MELSLRAFILSTFMEHMITALERQVKGKDECKMFESLRQQNMMYYGTGFAISIFMTVMKNSITF